ncbi:type IVa secretion system protein IcmB [Coxiella burnetii]|uniref:type IVa secretion system protein IcmB n=1 Tax=Coxiella burnetii TaxID=777 RepID=UPI0000ED0257|nr:type IVa secretion system protein IcmB [Coxiella burnetii]ACJ20962.1 IcmB [Coxiella burnetii CbuK_Q154]ATN86534.1 type IV secretion protein IcmB [Coxiella burnetii str. Schperling]EAX33521.1 type IV secretion protein IcmB [Coxiella burnetii 'MSU Goat Q177']EDR35503.1 IcmB protein [Coxiella burnetii Q321]PHH56971.1 type IV secretion protein IcmB [Coxiella burnetii]
MKIIKSFAGLFDSLFAWLSNTLKQSTSAYCELQTADSSTVLVAHDGSLISVLRLEGVTALIGREEFDKIQTGLQHALQTVMSQPGHVIQVYFSYNKDEVRGEINEILQPAEQTAKRLSLQLGDLFKERMNYLTKYCAHEEIYIVLWTRLKSLTNEQIKRSTKEKRKQIKKQKIPPFKLTQNLIAAIPDLRENHDSFVRSVVNEFNGLGLITELLEVHDAVYIMRRSADPEFTDREWRPLLPGDKITIKEPKAGTSEVSDILWPALARQILPRDAENLDLRTARVGDRIYATVFINLFPKDIQTFVRLFTRTLQTRIPWRISFLFESDGLAGTSIRKMLSSVLSVTSTQNRLIHDSLNLLNYINLNTDDAVVKLRVSAATWAPEGDIRLLRARAAMLAKAIEGWGSCDVSEISGDAYEGVVSTMIGISGTSVATASIAPLSNVLYMLPLFRPASPWTHGALLFRSPDGKPWPYQPGSHQQTTWIDLFYARPGSGKSVLSNNINLAVCLSSGIQRLPHISIIDIGPSSSGLILLLKDALPADKKYLVAYHRLRMRSDYAINPFDTQLGCRYPTPQERAFLVNFLSLLATPIGSEKTYDGVADMAGLIIDELYKNKADDGNPNTFALGMEENIDGILEEIGFVQDDQTTWWEVTDALFMAGFTHEAMLAQRHAMPVLADVAAICRLPAIQDLYGKIVAPTGEPLIHAFARMISSAVREYPIISQVTRFDLGDARVVALDLDEVARSGGDAANRQTAVMYMLARYVLGRHYFLTDDNVADMPEGYRHYHQARIAEIREDPKRIVFDEFHRTAKAQAVRDQVIQDMREGRKWKVQVALLSQSLDDFDEIMVEFATSIFIMDAGPEQTVRKTAEIFGLSHTAEIALKTRVHGPREDGATFLAQFATKNGLNTQLLTATLGPVELWSLNTTAEDVNIRNQLYKRIGPKETRRILATMFPSGTATKALEDRYADYKEEGRLIDDTAKHGIMQSLINEILETYYSEKESAVV